MVRRSVGTALLLVLGGLGCVGLGAVLGSRQHDDAPRLWRDADQRIVGETRLPSFRDVVDRVGPSVVSVRVTTEVAVRPQQTGGAEELASAPTRLEGSRRNGSGFVVHERGLVLTSRHVIAGPASEAATQTVAESVDGRVGPAARGDGAPPAAYPGGEQTRIEVFLPEFGWHEANLMGEDEATDLALLRLESAPKGLQALPLGDSDELCAGDWIVAVGNPFGFARTVTAGLVSFVGRKLHHSDLGVSSDFLQISAPINPGNSGGPVFDVHGNVVGVINQFAKEAQGISFAVPSHSVRWALAAMERQPDGRVRRGYLGIEFSARSERDESGRPMPGARILDVRKGQPADRAGLKVGDVVLGVDGEPVRDPQQLYRRIVCSDPGTVIALQLLRDDRECDPIVAVLGAVGSRTDPDSTN